MKWIVCGKNSAGARCLEFLVGRGDEAWAIGVGGDDGRDGWQRSFVGAARGLGVRVDQPRRINDPAFVEQLAAFGAHALLSVQYDQILRGTLFQAIGCPCLNLHFALLPRHRGVAPIAWAVREGDAEAGVTLHHMIEDIDAGDVIAQKAVPIRGEDTAREVYDRVSDAAVALLEESYPFDRELLATRLVQDSAVASYHRAGDFDFSKRRIDWNRPARELQSWIRAMIFPPMQYPETSLRGREHWVTRVAGAIGDPVTAPPGVVVGRSAEGVDVATRDRPICVRELLAAADPRARADAVLASIAVGDRFA